MEVTEATSSDDCGKAWHVDESCNAMFWEWPWGWCSLSVPETGRASSSKTNETGDCRGVKDTHNKISVLKDHFYSVDTESRHRKEERENLSTQKDVPATALYDTVNAVYTKMYFLMEAVTVYSLAGCICQTANSFQHTPVKLKHSYLTVKTSFVNVYSCKFVEI